MAIDRCPFNEWMKDLVMNIRWNEPEAAPKNGDQFIGKIKGYQWPTSCAWNGVEKQWVYVWLKGYDKSEDNYFDSELAEENELLGWIKLDE